jgi:hypothetical protein
MISCRTEWNQDYVLGALSASEAGLLEQHLLACARCAREVEEFRTLFVSLQELPLPLVPPGIADAVIARLAPQSAYARLIDQLHIWTRQPVFAAAAGIVSGLLLTVFREPLALHFGRMTGGLVAGVSGDLAGLISGILRNLREMTTVLEVLARLVTKLEPLLRTPGLALRFVAGHASLVSILLSLATVLFLGRMVGQIGREELSHAKH